jgi:hypothetical protein
MSEFRDAVSIVESSGVVPLLTTQLDAQVGRPRVLSVMGLFVAAQLNALRQHHRAHLVQITRILNSMTEQQRRTLGIKSWARAGAYKRVVYLFDKVAQLTGANGAAE